MLWLVCISVLHEGVPERKRCLGFFLPFFSSSSLRFMVVSDGFSIWRRVLWSIILLFVISWVPPSCTFSFFKKKIIANGTFPSACLRKSAIPERKMNIATVRPLYGTWVRIGLGGFYCGARQPTSFQNIPNDNLAGGCRRCGSFVANQMAILDLVEARSSGPKLSRP